MQSLSRRSFLHKSTIAAGAVGAAAVVPSLGRLGLGRHAAAAGGLAGGAESTLGDHAEHEHSTEGPIVARVRDVRSGEIELFVGTRKVTLRDPAMAARLHRATR